jgi:hypothetical protein
MKTNSPNTTNTTNTTKAAKQPRKFTRDALPNVQGVVTRTGLVAGYKFSPWIV